MDGDDRSQRRASGVLSWVMPFIGLLAVVAVVCVVVFDVTDDSRGHPFDQDVEFNRPEGRSERYYEKDGSDYRGSVSLTARGRDCIPWDRSDMPPNRYPEEGLEENFCRNPDHEKRPWCYTDVPVYDSPWDYCDVGPVSSVETRERYTLDDASDYRGWIQQTVTGKKCLPWDQAIQNRHNRPGAGLWKSYCRNPDGSETAWCYVDDPTAIWEYCDVGPQAADASDYRGHINVTESGRSCVPWKDTRLTEEILPDGDLIENFCRNPDGEEKAWCFFSDEGRKANGDWPWEYCDIGRKSYNMEKYEQDWEKEVQYEEGDIERFAPKFFFHSLERFFPASVDWFLEFASLGNQDKPDLVVHDLNLQVLDEHPEQSNYMFLSNEEDRQGQVPEPVGTDLVIQHTTLYAHVVADMTSKHVDIQYYVFFPWNGCTFFRTGLKRSWTKTERRRTFQWCDLEVHGGEFKRVTVRVLRDFSKVLGVYFARRDGGEWVGVDQLSFEDETHVKVIMSLNTHIPYPFMERDTYHEVRPMPITWIPNQLSWLTQVDKTNPHGAVWEPWQIQRGSSSVEELPDRLWKSAWTTQSYSWMKWKGRWGGPTTLHISTPSLQDETIKRWELPEDGEMTVLGEQISQELLEPLYKGLGQRAPNFLAAWNGEEERAQDKA